MMDVRFIAELHFNPGSGLAIWGQQQMQQRLSMAYPYWNEGSPLAAESRVEVDGDSLFIDCIWSPENRSMAQDTWDTFRAPAIEAQLIMWPYSWMVWHDCARTDGQQGSCVAEQTWTNAPELEIEED